MIRVILALCLFVIANVNLAVAEEITIAAASDLNFAFREVCGGVRKSERQSGQTDVRIIRQFLLADSKWCAVRSLLSADLEYPQKLEGAGLTVPGSFYQYAIGRIVLWTGA